MGNIDAEGVVDDIHREPGAVEGIRPLPGIDIGIPLELQSEVNNLLARSSTAGLASWLFAGCHRIRRPDGGPGNEGDVDIAANARTVDRLPLALRLRPHLDGHAFVEHGKRLGPPLRGSQTRGPIATRVRDVGRGDRLSKGFGPA
jgi:hypothetical protein